VRELLRDINFYSPTESKTPVRNVTLFVGGSTPLAQAFVNAVEMRRGMILKRAHVALNVAAHGQLDNLIDDSRPSPNPIVVDCGDEGDTSRHYSSLLSRGIRILCLNGAALSSYTEEGREGLLIDTLIGGGLPLLSSLRDFRRTGDRVRAIEVVGGGEGGDLSLVLSEIVRVLGWEVKPYEGGGKITIAESSLKSVYLEDPPADRTFAITTDRYWASPLVLQGPVPSASLLAHVAISELLHVLG